MAYQNEGRGSANAHVLLEWGAREQVDIIFIGEAWRDREGKGNTQQRGCFFMGAGFDKDQIVVAYWKTELKEKIRVTLESKRAIGIEIEGRFIGAVYGATGDNREGMENWLQSLEGLARGHSGILMGDWNAHCEEWDEEVREDGKGKALKEWMEGNGFNLVQPDGATWCRFRDGKISTSTIDLVWTKEIE